MSEVLLWTNSVLKLGLRTSELIVCEISVRGSVFTDHRWVFGWHKVASCRWWLRGREVLQMRL